MSAPAKLAGFAALLALVTGGAALAGGAVDPDRDTERPAAHAERRAAHAERPAAHAEQRAAHAERPAAHAEQTRGHAEQNRAHTEDDPMTTNAPHAQSEHAVRGLAVAEDELRVVVADPELRRGERERLAFRIVDARGATVRDFDVEHERRMHLIVVRRDLTGFQHLHPTQASDGTWTADVELDAAGSYRLFADFARDGEPHTLGADLRVDGPADLRPLPAPAATARSDGGYDVRLQRDGDRLRFAISRDGEAVETEPYLGAGGHLVVLREGDLAFLHVHPEEDGVSFAAKLPSAGRYRLFLQFKHAGRVHTVAFTEVSR